MIFSLAHRLFFCRVVLWTVGVGSGVFAAGTTQAEDYIWLEGEKPTTKNVEAGGAAWGRKELLSGESWLLLRMSDKEVAEKLPKEGALFGYQFEAKSPGHYEVWGRMGYEGNRAPFEWRTDQGDWQTIKPETPSVELCDLDMYCPIIWLKLGQADLSAGKHSLEFRLKPWFKEDKGKQVPQGLLFACDAICLSKDPFRPNGKHKPDDNWQTEDDKKAAQQVFELQADGAGSPERVELPLSGLWQVGRFDEQEVVDRDGPTKTLPDPNQIFWMSAKVPGNKFKAQPELLQCHRLIYRTRVKVPAEFTGRSFILRFPAISLIGSLFVNGQYCGFTKTPFALWECDATAAIKPGQINEICMIIKDNYYAISPKLNPGGCRAYFQVPLEHFCQNWSYARCDFPIGKACFDVAGSSGLLLTPRLVVAGPAYTSDVFALPSVKDKKLGLEITLTNPGTKEQKVQVVNEIVPAAGGAPEKVFAAQDVTLAPGKNSTVKLAEPWANPKLWWPDDPQMYQVVTKVSREGQVVDVRRTPFGFRQWEWDGPQFKLNGVPWNLRGNNVSGADGFGTGTVEQSLADMRLAGQDNIRYWNALGGGGLEKSQVLDALDRTGIIARRNGIMEGMGCNYLHALARNDELFDNWLLQLTAQIKEERNHPSIYIWSIENELTFINARNLGLLKAVEPHITQIAQAVMALDPTRPVMIDGGNCLSDQSLPVNGAHYIETSDIPFREYPDQAYTWEKIVENEKKTFPLALDRPIVMGECFFMNGYTPGDYAQFAGEGCFTGWGPYTQRGGGLFAKMLTEGCRWHGIAGWQLGVNGSQVANLHYNSQKPVVLFCRQWNWTFAGGSEVGRTLKLFNDTHYNDPIEAAWELTMDGKRVAGDKKTFNLAPGEHQEFEVTVNIPPVAQRTGGEFILTCARGGKEVFRDVKPVAVLDPNAGPKPALAQGDLLVLDPLGSVKSRLQTRGIPFTEVASVAEVPATAKVVIIGKDAVNAREATDPKWVALAGNGAKVLVLDQANPLHFSALPSDLTPTDFVGRTAFEENTTHPIFAGLDQPDFFTWSKDHIVYRNVYSKPTHGATSLAHCDTQLNYSAIAECPVNNGLLLLCQMVVGEKLAFDPVAQRLFDNMLAYCTAYTPVRYETAVVLPPGSPALKLLGDSGLKFDPAPDALTALSDGKHQIVVFDANPAALKALADNLDKVKAFTAKGGWLMAWGLTPDGLASFNKLVGVEHILRPFDLEYVNLPAQRDPLLSGVSIRDVALESTEQIFNYAGTKYMVDDEFNWIVDLDDIAPFGEFAGAKAGDHAAARQAGASWPRNLVNGFTSDTAWMLIYYMKTASPKISMTLPRPEEITSFGIVLNPHYAKAQKVNLYYDDDPKPVSLSTKPDNSRQDFELPPRQASRLTIELADFDAPKRIMTGIDNVWIGVQRGAEWRQKVKPLLNIGGLVKYPMGQGGLILNQLSIKPSEPNPINMQKKQNVVVSLLRNLHAAFSGSKVLTVANLKYQPLPLDEQCNQYLSQDHGWLTGKRDLSHLPVGENKLAGVPFLVRDFKTSPVPSCIMLDGPGVSKVKLPKEVKGLKVGCQAEVLFFLHTFNNTAKWQPGKPPADVPPAVFKYVVHYADGQTAEIPVLLGEGVAHWISPNPAGLKATALAWSANFPAEDAKDQAVVFQFPWTNPRADVPIQTIDLMYGPDGSKYGTPALLAITAATSGR